MCLIFADYIISVVYLYSSSFVIFLAIQHLVSISFFTFKRFPIFYSLLYLSFILFSILFWIYLQGCIALAVWVVGIVVVLSALFVVKFTRLR